MRPIFFSFRQGIDEQARAIALERVRALPEVETAGELFPAAVGGTSAGAMVAAVGEGFETHEVVAALRGIAEVEEVSEAAERELIG